VNTVRSATVGLGRSGYAVPFSGLSLRLTVLRPVARQYRLLGGRGTAAHLRGERLNGRGTNQPRSGAAGADLVRFQPSVLDCSFERVALDPKAFGRLHEVQPSINPHGVSIAGSSQAYYPLREIGACVRQKLVIRSGQKVMTNPMATRRRYVVKAQTAYRTDGRNVFDVEGGIFDRKGMALEAAQQALGGFRVCRAKVEREVWIEETDPIHGTPLTYWGDSTVVRELSRYLTADERITDAERASK
jgi:hypothetical protein